MQICQSWRFQARRFDIDPLGRWFIVNANGHIKFTLKLQISQTWKSQAIVEYCASNNNAHIHRLKTIAKQYKQNN